jgi:hypothetical protein
MSPSKIPSKGKRNETGPKKLKAKDIERLENTGFVPALVGLALMDSPGMQIDQCCHTTNSSYCEPTQGN